MLYKYVDNVIIFICPASTCVFFATGTFLRILSFSTCIFFAVGTHFFGVYIYYFLLSVQYKKSAHDTKVHAGHYPVV